MARMRCLEGTRWLLCTTLRSSHPLVFPPSLEFNRIHPSRYSCHIFSFLSFLSPAPELLHQCWPPPRPVVLVPGQRDDGLPLHRRRGHRLRRHHLRAQPHRRGGADLRGFQRCVDGADKEHDHNPAVDDLFFHDIGVNNSCDKFDKHRELDQTPQAAGIRSQKSSWFC